MRPESRALAEVLLEHHREVCLGAVPGTPIDACVLPYGDLCQQAGLAHLTRSVGQFLQEVAEWCHANGWPPINSLAVNADSRMPGDSYDVAPGCSILNWPNEAEACIAFEEYPVSL